jgi:hypothetical protein
MSNLKIKSAKLAAVFGCALTLGLGLLITAVPVQARAGIMPDTTARPHLAAAIEPEATAGPAGIMPDTARL